MGCYCDSVCWYEVCRYTKEHHYYFQMGNALNSSHPKDHMDDPMIRDNDDDERWNKRPVGCSLAQRGCHRVRTNLKGEHYNLECAKYCRNLKHQAAGARVAFQSATQHIVNLQQEVQRLHIELLRCQQNQQSTTQDCKYEMEKLQRHMQTKMRPDLTQWSGMEREVEALQRTRQTLEEDVEKLYQQYESTEDTWRLLSQQCNRLRAEIEILRYKARGEQAGGAHSRSSENRPPEEAGERRWASGEPPPEEEETNSGHPESSGEPEDNLTQFMPPRWFSDASDAVPECVNWYSKQLTDLTEDEVDAMQNAIKQCHNVKRLCQLLCVKPDNPDAICVAIRVLWRIMGFIHPDKCDSQLLGRCQRLWNAVNEMWGKLKENRFGVDC